MRGKVKGIALLSGLAMIFALLQFATTAASATLTAAKIRLVTPSLQGDVNAWNGQQLMNTWVGNTWYAAGSTFTRAYAPVGSNIILTYYATDAATDLPLIDTEVKLRVNKAYSGSNALVKVGSSATTNGIEKSNGTDQLQVTGKTDQFGYVTFILDNVDTVGEPQPASLTTEPPALSNDANPAVSLYSQIFPEITGQSTDQADMTEFHFYQPGNTPLITNNLATTTTRLAAPFPTETTAISRVDLETLFSVTNPWYAVGIKVWQKYHEINTTSNLAYTVKDANGAWVGNTQVTFSVGKAYSGSNANVTDGTTATNTGAANDQDQAQWIATTDPFGTVMFNLKNTDTSGITKPESMITPVAEANKKFTQIWPVVAGSGSNVADMLEYHFYQLQAPPEPEDTSFTLTKKKSVVKVTVNSPNGKAVSISVGGYKFTHLPSSDSVSVSYNVTLPKGKSTIKVLCNGVSKTKSFVNK
jgi:hypothetical protein